MNHLMNVRKSRNISFYVITFLIFFSQKIFPQSSFSNSGYILSDSISSAALFSIEKHSINATLDIFKNESGELSPTPFNYISGNQVSYYNMKLSIGEKKKQLDSLKVNYQNVSNATFDCLFFYEKKGTIDPFKVEIPYQIHQQAEAYWVSPLAILDPMVCRYDPTTSTLSYEGTDLAYPTNVVKGQTLQDAKGNVFIKVQNGFELKISIAITQRQLLDIAEVVKNGQSIPVFTFTNNIHYELVTFNKVIKTIDEVVIEKVMQGKGILFLQRTSPEMISNLTSINN